VVNWSWSIDIYTRLDFFFNYHNNYFINFIFGIVKFLEILTIARKQRSQLYGSKRLTKRHYWPILKVQKVQWSHNFTSSNVFPRRQSRDCEKSNGGTQTWFIFRRENKNIEKSYVATHRLVFHLIQNSSNETDQTTPEATAALINAFVW